MSYERDTKAEFGLGGTIYAFNVNASYARTYGYREEASSKIKISMAAVPRPQPAPEESS